MHQFFVEDSDVAGSEVTITGSDVNHIRNVLRMKAGMKICVSVATGGSYICELRELGSAAVRAEIIAEDAEGTELPNQIFLFQGLPKGDKMELVIQKAVELGASAVVPVAMKNCVVRLTEEKAEARARRWQGIAESAAKQSGRGVVPKVMTPMGFAEALKLAAGLDVLLLPYEREYGMATAMWAMEEIRLGDSIGIFIGPEGGFAPEEIEAAGAAGARRLSLGRRILRTETAGLALLSVLMFRLEALAESQEGGCPA